MYRPVGLTVRLRRFDARVASSLPTKFNPASGGRVPTSGDISIPGLFPEIVTLGKPMANRHPAGGVVTQSEYLETFRRDFRYFNTFGGNPVSAAAALATLIVVEDEQLMENARLVGDYARAGLAKLARSHASCIGDVHGRGLMFRAELV